MRRAGDRTVAGSQNHPRTITRHGAGLGRSHQARPAAASASSGAAPAVELSPLRTALRGSVPVVGAVGVPVLLALFVVAVVAAVRAAERARRVRLGGVFGTLARAAGVIALR